MLLKLLPAAVLAFALGACKSSGSVPAERPQADARSAVSGLVQDYEVPRNEAFFDRIDPMRFPRFEDFREAVRQFQIENRNIVLDIIVDGVDEAPNDADHPDLGVRAHWNKSFVDPKGSSKLQNGQCELDFRRQPSGGLLLTNVHGASPF